MPQGVTGLTWQDVATFCRRRTWPMSTGSCRRPDAFPLGCRRTSPLPIHVENGQRMELSCQTRMLRLAMRLPSPTLPELQRMTRKHAVMVVHVHVRARARCRRVFRTSGRSSERPLPPTEQPTPVRRAKVHTPTLPSLDAQHSGWRVHWVGVMMIVDALRRRVRGPYEEAPRKYPEPCDPSDPSDRRRVVGGGGCQNPRRVGRWSRRSRRTHAEAARVFLCRLLPVPARREGVIHHSVEMVTDKGGN